MTLEKFTGGQCLSLYVRQERRAGLKVITLLKNARELLTLYIALRYTVSRGQTPPRSNGHLPNVLGMEGVGNRVMVDG